MTLHNFEEHKIHWFEWNWHEWLKLHEEDVIVSPDLQDTDWNILQSQQRIFEDHGRGDLWKKQDYLLNELQVIGKQHLWMHGNFLNKKPKPCKRRHEIIKHRTQTWYCTRQDKKIFKKMIKIFKKKKKTGIVLVSNKLCTQIILIEIF